MDRRQGREGQWEGSKLRPTASEHWPITAFAKTDVGAGEGWTDMPRTGLIINHNSWLRTLIYGQAWLTFI